MLDRQTSLPERVIHHGNANKIVTSDASSLGWAGISNGQEIGGRWASHESGYHINYLELLAASHSIKACCRATRNMHVQIISDSACAVAYINNMCGCKSNNCNSLARDLWVWCIQRSIWLSASHVPGCETIADHGSRHFNENVE